MLKYAHFKEDLGWFSIFMLIGVLFLPTTNWLHKINADVSTAGLQSSSGQTPQQSKRRHFDDDEFCEANLWLVEREPQST